jgi:Icc-related predicted phosphoesterase
LKFVAIADTHGKHKELILPLGDILIHAGDISMKGEEREVVQFLDWFSQQDFAHKILIAGNHDFYFEREPEDQIEKIMPPGITYLKDSGIVLNDYRIWGSPITPWFFDWAFNRHRGDPIRRHWDLIPADTDILITHGPPFRVLDSTREGQHVGCKDLLHVIDKVRPKAHLFGHIHESYGELNRDGTRCINASVLNEKYELTNKPIVFEI